MRPAKVFSYRRTAQLVMLAVVVVIGVQFTLWLGPQLAGRWPQVGRPAGVEGFLPIDGMMALRHFLDTGVVDPIHPAALAIFLGICLMSVVVAKSFCSHLCPVGLFSEFLGRTGFRVTGKRLTPPKWIDIPLRSLKYLVLGFFVWAVWFSLSPRGIDAFLHSPYAKLVDVKMWLFFAHPSRLTIAVLGALVVASVFVRDFWCRYLCPYGALLGMLGRLAPFKVTRDPDVCTDCRACTNVCPARLEVHRMTRVASFECTSCQDCVMACPVDGCLAVRSPFARSSKRWLRPIVATGLALGMYLAVLGLFRLTGHWSTAIPAAEYHRRLPEVTSPLYTHVGGVAMAEGSGAPTSRAAVPHASPPGESSSHPLQ
ncbi:MAG: 4Fe-4S binding protein [Acidobacteria bacterium]|nr:4Fe-4S binding protein [Acidobacteriota bacterium]